MARKPSNDYRASNPAADANSCDYEGLWDEVVREAETAEPKCSEDLKIEVDAMGLRGTIDALKEIFVRKKR